ncbi:T9SS type A sorting domain-containing protein [Ferruginibacter sp.]|nr:T9SS type A sorting domain-containing protein [Ferruginibacter sp.]
MKNCTLLLVVLFFLLPKSNSGQCNYSNTLPISVGQIIVDTAFCPSGGKITLNNVTGGGGYYVYEIISGPVIRIIQSQNVFNALPAGQYRVRVTGCNGAIKDIWATVINKYSSISIYSWQQTIEKVSGLECGITNNGVYKITKPAFPGGSAPYRIQIASSTNFSAVPFEPGYDSTVFSGLNASAVYYVRITDACNNFQTTSFATPAATPVVPLSVPSLTFQRSYWTGSCSGNETMNIGFIDSATGTPYNVNNLYSNKVFWGNKNLPYLRIKIENSVNGYVYSDRHISVNNNSNLYSIYTNYQYNGETGLTAPGTGFVLYGFYTAATNTLPQMYPGSEFPANAPLKITIFFPGGTHCGTPVPAYTKTFLFNLGTHATTQPKITAISNNCSSSSGSYFRVDYNINFFQGKLSLVDPSPVYTVLKTDIVNPGSNTFSTLYYSPLIIGHTYRLILEDTCGRKDSSDIVYNPGGSLVPAPVIKDTVQVKYKCPANPNDTIYTILLKPLPAGYNIVSASIAGYGNVSVVAVPNWNGGTQTGFKLNKLLPPGTYTYKVAWLYQCQTDTIVNTITIIPEALTALYSRELILTSANSAMTCSANGFTAIEANVYLKNINTDYSFSYLRLTGVPNNYVFPLKQLSGSTVENINGSIYYYTILSGDTIKTGSGYSGIIINTGQEGTYTFAVDIRCPDGTLVETISKSITISSTTPYLPNTPSLKYANALICDGGGTEAKINMLPVGGTRPFYYEYKLETSSTYLPTGNGGADSVVVITPAPAPGTIYDIRVVDACGKTATSKVSIASFTGKFYIYQYPPDCINHPFDTRVTTSAITGAYYTWKRNGITIAEGYNLSGVTLTGITMDSISVTVNMFDCYTRTVSKIVVFTNPCGFIVLPLKNLNFFGNRFSATNVQLNWQAEKEEDMERYEIEKSVNGTLYNYLASIKAENAGMKYFYNDDETSELIFYRLKIIDKAGGITYSNIIKIENNIAAGLTLRISPNPTSNSIIIKLVTKKTNAFKAKLYDAKGQLLKNFTISPEELVSGKIVDIATLPAGSYIISMTDSNGAVAFARFMKF